MPTSRSERLVLVTGASSGIGREAAKQFVERGDRVIAVARSGERLAALASEVGTDRLHTLVADVTEAASMSELARSIREAHGVPDVIVANAGIGLDARFADTTDEALRAVLEVNVVGVYRTVRPFLADMVSRGSGRVIVVSSIVGKRGIPHYSAYSASKFALHGMAEAMRAELYGTGVTVGLVCPSSTSTEFQDRLLREGPAQRRMRPRRHPPSSVASAIVSMAGSRRAELVLSLEARLLCLANAIAPRLVDRFLGKALTR